MLRIAGTFVSPRRVRWLGYSTSGAYVCRGSTIASDCVIGAGTRINGPIIVKGAGRLDIGKYCAIGAGVRVITQNHNISLPAISLWLSRRVSPDAKLVHPKDVAIGHNVWIGDSVIILPGVSVGVGAVIGAGSVVTRDIAPYAIAVGNPARVVRSRWRDEFSPMEANDFWLQDDEEIVRILEGIRLNSSNE